MNVGNRTGEYLIFEQQGESPIGYLQKVPEKKTAKSRMHIDISVEDVDAASAQVEALGGRKLQVVEEFWDPMDSNGRPRRQRVLSRCTPRP